MQGRTNGEITYDGQCPEGQVNWLNLMNCWVPCATVVGEPTLEYFDMCYGQCPDGYFTCTNILCAKNQEDCAPNVYIEGDVFWTSYNKCI